jgi:hypothetical protein
MMHFQTQSIEFVQISSVLNPLLTIHSQSISVLILFSLPIILMINDAELLKAWKAGKKHKHFTVRGMWTTFSCTCGLIYSKMTAMENI